MRGSGLEIAPYTRLADDGKRLEALDAVFRRDSFIYKGGSLREGGQNILTDTRVGGGLADSS